MSNTTKTMEDDRTWEELDLDDTALQSLLDNSLDEPDTSKLRNGEQHMGFDNNMGETWIYPNNMPCRSYQMSIVQAALYRNTLVVLPTGLGKTFIAAVVMYNFYRWYPRGKIIFMAPTRPLVNQQIEACQKIMPFPKKDTVELTGKLQKSKRIEMWRSKRVFFATPQVVQSDIFGGRQQEVDSTDESSFRDEVQTTKTYFPFELVKLIVIDEAHKAKGKYAYSEVAQALARNTKYFRVLALSATPGRTMEDVAEVCRNLLISHLEVRWDTSIDVLPYVHKRSMDTVVVSMGDKIKEIREQLLLITDPYLRQLTGAEVLSGSLTNINRNFLLYEQKRFRDRSFHIGRHPEHSTISSNFAICISLYHALELLERHGLRVFLNNFEADEDGKNKFVLQMDRRLNDLVENLKKQMGPNPFEISAAPMTNGQIAEIPKDLDFGHPKFERTRECLLKFFENNQDSRAIVFCEYRESVLLIYRMLLQHVPLLKPRCFVGQGGTGTLRALTQKQQIQIMNDFRSGKSNILIATSIGEEGIDVGEVELIVCFDISTSNPIRFVQRIGRTGRKKNGHVIMMVTEGREQQLLREVLSHKDQINKKLLKSSVVQQSLYKYAPRLVPTEFKPKCVQTFVKPPSDDEEIPIAKNKLLKKKMKSPEKCVQDLRKFFKKKPKEYDKEDLEFFENDTNMSQAKPGLQTQQNIVDKLNKMKNLFKDLQPPIATQTQKPIKNTQTKLSNSQGTIKDFFKESCTKNKAKDSLNTTLNGSQTSFDDLNNPIISLTDKGCSKDRSEIADDKPSTKKIDPERMRTLKKFLSMTLTTPEVLKRAEINDLGYHLKSKELSREMKTLLLTRKPEYIKENLEKIQVLNALHDDEAVSYSEEEQSIREINSIILDLFGGLEKVEKFLDDLELDKYRQQCLDSDSESEEEDPEELETFQKKLDNILKGYGDGKRHDNYDWIQERLKQTSFYKDNVKSQEQSKAQESMVYDHFAEAEDEDTFNNMHDYSITESKYCSQWQDFTETDIGFKSTPLQGTYNRPIKREEAISKTSLLSKLQKTTDEHELDEQKNDGPNTSANTTQVQNMLVMLANKLNESSLNETKTASPEDDLEELENMFKAKRKDYEMRMLESESTILSTSPLENFNLPDEDDLIKAADEAEIIFAQNQSKKDTSLQDSSKTPPTPKLTIDNLSTKEGLSSTTKITSASFNSTPELDLNSRHLKKPEKASLASPLPLTPDLSLQQELDIDMEVFLEPFSEEQELLESTQSYVGAETLKEYLTSTSAIARESPDLFAEEHIRSPIKKPIVCKKESFTTKLSTKSNINPNIQKCQSWIQNPVTSRSPQKPLFSTQNPKQLNNSPTNRLVTDKQKCDKSPSLFDMYLKNTKGKGKLPKSLAKSLALTSSENMKNNVSKSLKDSPLIPASQQNESVIVVRSKQNKTSKRKIFDSDSEHEEEDNKQLNGLSAIDEEDNSDYEEVAATQELNEGSIMSIIQQRKKRRRFNSFIQQEADVSGSLQSQDEDDHTIGCYIHDSVVVPSDEEDPDQASTSHMQAVYLQSLKSPQQRRGTFKIPALRVYNDRSRIFSQPLLPEETLSQYLPDSFVVDEEDSFINENANVSMCPLERAEKILKERNRSKKLGILDKDSAKKRFKSKSKIQLIDESSDDDDFE